MKIEIGLNKQSIKNAIKQLNAIKKTVPKMQQEFLMEVAHWITDRANDYITNSDLGSLVKDQIRSSWSYEPTANGVKIVNRAEKAVYVEFGVGVVGQSQAHPNATAEGYEYNMDSPSKSTDGSWTFFANSAELDLPKDALLAHNWYEGKRGKGGEKGKRLLIMTRGAKGVWYAYNAIVDAQMELAKPNGGKIGELWEKVKKRYIK